MHTSTQVSLRVRSSLSVILEVHHLIIVIAKSFVLQNKSNAVSCNDDFLTQSQPHHQLDSSDNTKSFLHIIGRRIIIFNRSIPLHPRSGKVRKLKGIPRRPDERNGTTQTADGDDHFVRFKNISHRSAESKSTLKRN